MLKSFTGTAELWAAPTVGHGLVLYTNTKGHLVALAVPAYRSGTPDGGAPDAGSSDAGTVDQGGTLFSDDFQRTTGLGPSWRVISGAWKTSTRAESDLRGSDQAAVQGLSCMDCGVRAQVVNFAAGTAELDLRETTSGDRYDVALLSSGQLQIRRHVANAIVVLAQGPSGIADLSN
ncbi:MAG: hypothetical protein E6J63_06330 [Deltaproteobacteria bacterium]|nr:MAG: hypothetical protein E6J63_06330 [Deltaproteobacteria bacterium]